MHFSKSSPLNKESTKNVATLVHQFVEEKVAKKNEIPETRYCISIDVFSNSYETAPKSFLRRRNNIADACTEIDLWWDKV